MSQETYVPGVCNIGPAERAMRRKAGIASGVVSVVMIAVLLGTGAPAAWRLILFFPFAATAIGFFQSYFHFCVGYGLKGIYNVLKPAGQIETVEQEAFRAADRGKSLRIILLSCVVAGALTFVLILA